MSKRKPGSIKVSEKVKSALIELRHLTENTEPGEIDIRALERVESAFDSTLSPDILAAMSCEIDQLGINLAGVASLTEEARAKGCPPDLLAIGTDESGHIYYCVDRKPEKSVVANLATFDSEDGSVQRSSFASWLKERLETLKTFMSEGEDAQRERTQSSVSDDDKATFKPELVSPVGGETSQRFAEHPKFGRGKILRQIGDGADLKYEVAFPESGTKTLLARFVTIVSS